MGTRFIRINRRLSGPASDRAGASGAWGGPALPRPVSLVQSSATVAPPLQGLGLAARGRRSVLASAALHAESRVLASRRGLPGRDSRMRSKWKLNRSELLRWNRPVLASAAMHADSRDGTRRPAFCAESRPGPGGSTGRDPGSGRRADAAHVLLVRVAHVLLEPGRRPDGSERDLQGREDHSDSGVATPGPRATSGAVDKADSEPPPAAGLLPVRFPKGPEAETWIAEAAVVDFRLSPGAELVPVFPCPSCTGQVHE